MDWWPKQLNVIVFLMVLRTGCPGPRYQQGGCLARVLFPPADGCLLAVSSNSRARALGPSSSSKGVIPPSRGPGRCRQDPHTEPRGPQRQSAWPLGISEGAAEASGGQARCAATPPSSPQPSNVPSCPQRHTRWRWPPNHCANLQRGPREMLRTPFTGP